MNNTKKVITRLAYARDTIPHEFRCPHTIADMRPLFCQDCTVEEVEARYIAMNNLYRAGHPVVSDHTWDRYENNCRDFYPNCKTFWKVGKIDE